MLKSEIRGNRREYMEFRIYDDHSPEYAAILAFKLIERWGIVAGEPDGYDDAGRQKLRRLSASELVDEAFNVAELAMGEAYKRGLMHKLPEFPMEGEGDKRIRESEAENSLPT